VRAPETSDRHAERGCVGAFGSVGDPEREFPCAIEFRDRSEVSHVDPDRLTRDGRLHAKALFGLSFDRDGRRSAWSGG
jgi:hypothetical protein